MRQQHARFSRYFQFFGHLFNVWVLVEKAGSFHSVLDRFRFDADPDLTFYFDAALQRNPIYVFLLWELRGLSPNFHIHVPVSDLYMHRYILYIPRIAPHTVFPAAE